MYFRELCSTLFLLVVSVLVPLYMAHLSQWGRKPRWQRCMDLLVMVPLFCELMLGRVVCLAEALPRSLPPEQQCWLDAACPCRPPAQPGAVCTTALGHDLIPPINCINTFSPKEGMQTMCFLHWRIEKEAVSESLIIFAHKIRQRVWLSLLSKCYLPLTKEDKLC